MVGTKKAYIDSLGRLHLVRIDHASSEECVATIVESVDSRAVGRAVNVLVSELKDRIVFDIARKEIERGLGSVALRQANEIAMAAQVRAAGEGSPWR